MDKRFIVAHKMVTVSPFIVIENNEKEKDDLIVLNIPFMVIEKISGVIKVVNYASHFLAVYNGIELDMSFMTRSSELLKCKYNTDVVETGDIVFEENKYYILVKEFAIKAENLEKFAIRWANDKGVELNIDLNVHNHFKVYTSPCDVRTKEFIYKSDLDKLSFSGVAKSETMTPANCTGYDQNSYRVISVNGTMVRVDNNAMNNVNSAIECFLDPLPKFKNGARIKYGFEFVNQQGQIAIDEDRPLQFGIHTDSIDPNIDNAVALSGGVKYKTAEVLIYEELVDRDKGTVEGEIILTLETPGEILNAVPFWRLGGANGVISTFAKATFEYLPF